MRYRRFGATDLSVSELSLGTMTFGGKGIWEIMGGLGQAEAETLVATALDAGVNLIDTAEAYSDGESEKILGAVLASLGRPRDQVIIATQVRVRSDWGREGDRKARTHLISSVEASLRRLKLDHIDLLQIQGADCDTPVDEIMEVLDELVRSGKTRHVGFCNLPAWVAMKSLGCSDARGLCRFASAQVYYSIVGRDIEREVVPLARDQNLAILAWSPLAGGLLSGKFETENGGPTDARRSSLNFPPVDTWRVRMVLTALREVSEATGMSMARVSLAWLLSRGFVTSVILGARTREQLLDNLGATEFTLAPEHVALLDGVSMLPTEYPGWMASTRERICKVPCAL